MVLDRVLIVDDERLIRWSMKECLETAGYEAEAAESGKAALEALNQSPFDIVLLDYKLPDVNGLELLEKIKTSHVDIPVVMITAHSSLEHAVAATQAGAADYVAKPFQNDEIIHRVKKVLENKRLKKVVDRHLEENSKRYSFENIIGNSQEMQ